MNRLAAGDADALDVLVRRHHGFVVRHARRYVNDGAAADDIAQEVFMRVLRFADQFRRDDNFRGWLATLTTRLALNELRTRKRKHWRSSGAVESDADFRWRSVSSTELAEGEVLREERLSAVRQAIEALPESQRQALWLQRFEDFDLETIGSIMGLSVSAVKSLLHRARANLAEKLAPWNPLESGNPIEPRK